MFGPLYHVQAECRIYEEVYPIYVEPLPAFERIAYSVKP